MISFFLIILVAVGKGRTGGGGGGGRRVMVLPRGGRLVKYGPAHNARDRCQRKQQTNHLMKMAPRLSDRTKPQRFAWIYGKILVLMVLHCSNYE